MTEDLGLISKGCNWYQEIARGATVGDIWESIGTLLQELEARREIMDWVADKLAKLERLDPHEWDRCTLRDLQHALIDNPKLKTPE